MTTFSHDRAEELRHAMVETQLKSRDISDDRVLDAMGKTPRHEFIPDSGLEASYGDHPMPIGWGQTISQPYMVALMTQKLKLKGHEKVLEIGTGSGYQTAILSELCQNVVSIERVPQIYDLAVENLRGYKNVRIVLGDGTLGFPEEGPYDRILVTAAAPVAPPALLEQLSDKGTLVIPVGDHVTQILKIITKHGNDFSETNDTFCVFVPLIGAQGWKT
jgi:protein-L-isoaspartate(D-aspartate) O-methyltransferase